MSGRRRRRLLRDTEVRSSFALTYVNKPSDDISSILRGDMGSATILTVRSVKRINAINYVNQFYPQLVNFLDYFHSQFYNIIDMITNEADINTIISTARNLRQFISSKVENLNYIPGAESLVAELGRCETLLVDILEDLISGVELGIVLQRVHYMQRLLKKINDSFKD